MDPLNSNVMTLENQVLGFSYLTGCDANNLSISEQANANTSTTSDNPSPSMLLEDPPLVGFLNLTGDDMTLAENAAREAGWTVSWSTSNLNSDKSMVGLCVTYTIPNSTAVVTSLLVHARPYYAVLIDGTGEHNLADLNNDIMSHTTDIGCSVCWRKVPSDLYGIIKDRLVILISTSVNRFRISFTK